MLTRSFLMKRKLLILILCLLVIVPTLAGCGSFSVNPVKFYNAVVAKVEDTNITRQDLLSAYNSYGYTNYVTNGGQTVAEAMQSTLDLLTKRETLKQYAETATLTDETTKKYILNDYEINEMFAEVFDYFDSSFDSYMDKAREILGQELGQNEEEEEETKYTFSKYEKRANITTSSGAESVSYIDEDMATVPENYILDNSFYSQHSDIDTIAEELYETYVYHYDDQEVYDKAHQLLVQQLIKNNRYKRVDGKAMSTDSDDVLVAEFKRAYENAYTNAYISKIRTTYLHNESIDVDYLLRKFTSLYNTSEVKYSLSASDYNSDMLKDNVSVLYHPTSENADTFFYVYNLLLQFTDAQKSTYSALVSAHENNIIDESTYNTSMTNLKNEIPVYIRDSEGNKTLSTYTVADIENMLTTSIVGTDSQKLVAINNLIYSYNEDPGMFTGKTPYVIGLENSSMVDEFNEVSRELAEDGVFGSYEGTFTTYGYHIVFYAGNALQKINRSDVNSLTLTKLSQTYINDLTEYSYFDWLFDTVYPADVTDDIYSSNNGYSEYEDLLMSDLSNSYKVTIYSDVLKNMTKI